MDNLTHGLLGMAVAVCLAPPEARRQAACVGFLAGEFPDLDVLLRSEGDPLFGLSMHRHFTHSLLLAPVIGWAMAVLVMGYLRWRHRDFQPRVLILTGIAAALSHGLCDVWTSYGTRWFWPFSDARVSWDLISVIDPLLTLPLLLLVPIAIVKRSRRWSVIALSWVLCYVSLCFFQQQRVLRVVAEIASQRSHTPIKLTVKPSFGNVIVWRGLYQHENRAYVVCLRAWSDVSVLGQTDVKLVDPNRIPAVPPGSVLAKDIQRFAHFSDNWLAWHPQQQGVLGDLRYAVRPDSIAPLWGITVNPEKSDGHVEMLTMRRTREEAWLVLWKMIRYGKDSS